MSTTRRILIACALALAVVLIYAQGLQAQVPMVEGKGKVIETVEFSKVNTGNATDTVYTVPEGRRLIITDILVENTNSQQSAGIGLVRGTNVIFLSASIPPRGMFQHSFATGVQFTAGQPVRLFNGVPWITLWYLTGYLTKA
jgi:hypothetical protein